MVVNIFKEITKIHERVEDDQESWKYLKLKVCHQVIIKGNLEVWDHVNSFCFLSDPNLEWNDPL